MGIDADDLETENFCCHGYEKSVKSKLLKE